MNTLKLAPSNLGESTQDKSLSNFAHEYGVHDTMRYGFRSIADELVQDHPLQSRLAEWDQTQLNLKLNIQRQVHGLHAPFRTIMERDLIGSTSRHPMFKSSRFALDILEGKDESIGVEDFLNDPELSVDMPGTHSSMEHLLGFRC